MAKQLATDAGLNAVIYEFKWKTAARFEDQAYYLWHALRQIKEDTGQAPIVVAHSFGGVLAWTYLMDLAEDTNWDLNGKTSPAPKVPADAGSIKQLITVGSPIGGIAWVEEGGFAGTTHTSNTQPSLSWTLSVGKSTGDWSMTHGEQLTMTGAGGPIIGDDGKDNLPIAPLAVAAQQNSLKLRNFYAEPVGSVVAKIRNAAKTRLLPCPITSLVGHRFSVPPYGQQGFLDIEGDGLISLTGQTFLEDSGITSGWHAAEGAAFPGAFGNTYRTMSFGFSPNVYAGFRHTSSTILFNPYEFSDPPRISNFNEVNLPLPNIPATLGTIQVGGATHDHPLKKVLRDVIAYEAAHYQATTPVPNSSNVHAGPVTWDGSTGPSDQVAYRLAVVESIGGVRSEQIIKTGTVGPGGMIPSTAFNLPAFKAGESARWRLTLGDSKRQVTQDLQKDWAANVDFGAIHLASLSAATVSFTAMVQNTVGTPIPGAEVRLWEGLIPQATIQNTTLANTLKTRVLHTDSSGIANANGLAPSNTCTVLVQAAGYDPYYTTVSLAASGGVQFTMTVPTGNSVSITSFTTNPSTITPGQSAVLTPVFVNATSASINNSVGTVTSGTGYTVTPAATTTYTLTAYGTGGPKTRSLTVVVSIAPAQFTQQGPKLVGGGGSVSLSSDGNTAIGGTPGDNGGTGGALVWTRSGGVWTQQGTKLIGSGAVGGAFQGQSVALSADGNTALVGGHNDNSNAGAAWVWTRSGGVWTQQGAKLVGSSAVGGFVSQGFSVSLSGDGNTAVVGGPDDDGYIGAVWVWTRSGGIWTQQGTKLVGSGAVGAARQGYSVSLSGDGNTVIVGGYGDGFNGVVGAAWVWTRSGGVWTQQGTKLVGSGVALGAASQGDAVSLSEDGNTAIVGGYQDNGQTGAAWVWMRSGGVWTQQGTKLVSTGASGNAEQGWSVSLSGDGNTAIIGGVGDNGGNADHGGVGATWVWTRSGGIWTQQGSKLVGSGTVGYALQGYSVSLSADGNTAIIGGPGDNNTAGAAWVFTR